jgi:hypothetical protein
MVDDRQEGMSVAPARLFPPSSVEASFGSLPFAGEAKTLAEMYAAVAAEARRPPAVR